MILASLCNIPGNKSGLLLADDELSGTQNLKLPEHFPTGGITGLTKGPEEIVFVSQAGALGVFDAKTLNYISSIWPTMGRDIHSILLDKDRLYSVVTGMNAVSMMTMVKRQLSQESIVWKVSEERFGKDFDHLNSICLHEGHLLVSGFGLKEENLWSSCKNGFVQDVTTGRLLYERLCHPHTLTSSSRGLLICESANGRVINLTRGVEIELPGYSRGICEGENGFYVAVSKGREVSKSTGMKINNPVEGNVVFGESALYLLDKDSLKVKRSLLTGDLEYYDLVYVGSEANQWEKV